jgi:hypothetical protein
MISANPRRLSTILIVLGISAWIPFFVLLALGRNGSIFPFLIAHLAGVLGGAWIRVQADKAEGVADNQHGRKRKIISSILIYLGVLAWAPYFYLKFVVGGPVEIAPFLTAHLTGVLSGILLRASIYTEDLIKRD